MSSPFFGFASLMFALAGALWGVPLAGQTVPDFNSPTVNPPTSGEIRSSAASVERVGAGDLLAIAVANSPELTRNFRVSADGTLALPMLRQRLMVAGKDTPEIENELSEELVAEQILVQPVVSVSVAEFQSHPVSVIGAVHHAITFQATGNMTLMDALARADGLSDAAGSDILVTHSPQTGDSSAGSLVERIPVHRLIDEADPSVNIRIYGGEQIRVPFAGRVYVLGNVKKSGAYPILDNDPPTVMKILAESDGLAPYARKDAYILRKEAGKLERDEITVPIHDILERKAPDVSLQANDILYVPDAKGRRVTEQTLAKVLAFGVGTLSAYFIFH